MNNYCRFNRNPNCGCCKNRVRSMSIKLEESVLEIEIPKDTLCNHQPKCICLAQPIPCDVNGEIPVAIVVDGVKYNAVTKCGNFVYADQIRSNRMYAFRFASDTTHFVYCGGERLCQTSHYFNCIEPQAPEAAKYKRSTKKKTPPADVKE